jgi:hypothetical protein
VLDFQRLVADSLKKVDDEFFNDCEPGPYRCIRRLLSQVERLTGNSDIEAPCRLRTTTEQRMRRARADLFGNLPVLRLHGPQGRPLVFR